jgi:hypothetical protein
VDAVIGSTFRRECASAPTIRLNNYLSDAQHRPKDSFPQPQEKIAENSVLVRMLFFKAHKAQKKKPHGKGCTRGVFFLFALLD